MKISNLVCKDTNSINSDQQRSEVRNMKNLHTGDFPYSELQNSIDPSGPAPSIQKASPVLSTPIVEQRGVLYLEESNLWKQFNSIVNEMIITKTGRCLFPSLKFKAADMDPYALYKIELDFEQISPERYKFRNDEWVVVNNDLSKSQSQPYSMSEKKGSSLECYTTREYTHPDSPQSGAYWIKNGISFTKVKLTNRLESSMDNKVLNNNSFMDYRRSAFDPEFALPDGYFPLKTFHKYQPRVHLIKLNEGIQPVRTFAFEEAAFIAVTHYQNNAVNQLKKQYNPHAKGFRVIEDEDAKIFSARSRSLKRSIDSEEAKIPKRYIALSTYEKSEVEVNNQKVPSELTVESEKKLTIKADTYGLTPFDKVASVIQLPPPTPTITLSATPSTLFSPQQYEKAVLSSSFSSYCIAKAPATSYSSYAPSKQHDLPSISSHQKSKNSETLGSIVQLPPLGTSYEDPILLTSKVSSAATSLLLLSDRPLHFRETRKTQGFTN
ncbi:T-box-domain-containing protein [Basidiobolus meristosporus CBS 931.73]|uniref:T-box-domain-containing protein n=1 Tax=Basidiobolus meristosporus CBS 931.73 TaxID=1314790 RepID=A0A1Y1Z3J3_9FUNG|nr:T-box-domain-containing protein [Basidiobolus meristosporus CBS 931.73]|eukprot:ORY04425.1 T-box-domain-containing protein [Basidiobolus meristosporus CBS 931.73]